MLQPPRFKENTGFCCRCRQWKVLVIDRFQTSGHASKKKSSYCISCDAELNKFEKELRTIRAFHCAYSQDFPGHEDRILYHQVRIALHEGRAA